MEETKRALNHFERITFDRVQEMVHDVSRKLGKSWRLEYNRTGVEKCMEISTVFIYEGEKVVFRSFFGDNVAEACMYVVSFINGINMVLDICKSR